MPDTPLVTRAIEYAREPLRALPLQSRHAVVALRRESRSTANKLRMTREVLAVATLLHDLGLAKAFSGPLRFEVEGANAAREFARERGHR